MLNGLAKAEQNHSGHQTVRTIFTHTQKDHKSYLQQMRKFPDGFKTIQVFI